MPPPAAPAAPPASAPTPTPAPSPTPAPPAPSATPTPSPAPAPIDNPFADIDSAFRKVGQEPPGAPPAPPAPPKPGAPPAPPKPGTPPAPGRQAPLQLRQEYDRVKAEHTSAQAKITEYENKIRTFEEQGRNTEVLQQRLTDMEKTLQARESELYSIRAESDPAFIKEHDQPFNEAADFAASRIKQMTITDQATQTTRPATWDDFSAIYNLPYGQAWSKARELFGDAAPGIMNHVEELHRLQTRREKALVDRKAQFAEKQKTAQADRLKSQTELRTTWERLNNDLVSSVEEYRDPDGDQELAQSRAEGYRVFEMETKEPSQKLIKNAHIKQRVAAFGPNQITIRRQAHEIKQLKAELDKMRNPVPTPRSVGGGPPTPPAGGGDGKSWEEAAREELT